MVDDVSFFEPRERRSLAFAELRRMALFFVAWCAFELVRHILLAVLYLPTRARLLLGPFLVVAGALQAREAAMRHLYGAERWYLALAVGGLLATVFLPRIWVWLTTIRLTRW